MRLASGVILLRMSAIILARRAHRSEGVAAAPRPLRTAAAKEGRERNANQKRLKSNWAFLSVDTTSRSMLASSVGSGNIP